MLHFISSMMIHGIITLPVPGTGSMLMMAISVLAMTSCSVMSNLTPIQKRKSQNKTKFISFQK
jgi:hypothetical protein